MKYGIKTLGHTAELHLGKRELVPVACPKCGKVVKVYKPVIELPLVCVECKHFYTRKPEESEDT